MTWTSFLAAALCACVSLQARAELIRVGGTGSALGTMQLIGQAFEKANPQHRVEFVPALGSTGGLNALRAGQLQLALSNREPSADERAAGISGRVYGTTALAVVTHSAVPATAMTRERLALILAGREATWPNGRPVRLVLRPLSDGDTKLLASLSPAVGEALNLAHKRLGMVLAQTDTEAADYIERTPMALGLVTVAQVSSEKRKVNVLSLDGITPTSASVEAGRYPMVKKMVLSLRSDASPATRALADFVTTSPEAALILRRNGHAAN